jgi:hypothetical protein
VPFALRENVSPIGSRRPTFDGASSPSELSQFSTQTTSVPAATLTGWNRRIFLHLKLFNLSAPFLKLLKCATARTIHVKVIVKPARVLKFDFFLLRGSVKF